MRYNRIFPFVHLGLTGQSRHAAQLFIFSAIIMAACGISSPKTPLSESSSPDSSTPMDTGSSQSEGGLPFEGLWISESQDSSGFYEHEVLAITARNLYWVSGAANGVTEELYEVASYDLQNNHITLIKIWIRRNGVSFGFDYNPWLLTYAVQGDELRITIAGESEFPDEAISEPYYRW
jgi:hypothetical protein